MSHLVLFFDVEKTMMVIDPSQGKDAVSEVLNEMLADNSWGTEDFVTGEWTWDGAKRWATQNEEGEDEFVDEKKQALSYGKYLCQKFPRRGSSEMVKESKVRRLELRSTFTNEGQPGAPLRDEFERLLDCMTLPPQHRNSDAARSAGLTTDYYFILPSFLQLMSYLHSHNRSFNLVLRSFSRDIEGMVKEFNAFCEGKHPLFPGFLMDGTDGRVDRRIDLNEPSTKGTFYRDDNTTKLVMGTLSQLKEANPNLASYGSNCVMITGLKNVHNHLKKTFEKHGSLALRDYYPFWWSKYESSEAGKLMTVDPIGEKNMHPIFFDDSILRTSAHVVDVRDVRTGKQLPFDFTKDSHLVRVEPLHAIGNPRYFIDLVAKAEKAREEKEIPVVENEWR